MLAQCVFASLGCVAGGVHPACVLFAGGVGHLSQRIPIHQWRGMSARSVSRTCVVVSKNGGMTQSRFVALLQMEVVSKFGSWIPGSPIAFVVGVDSYSHLVDVHRCAADACDVADSLAALGMFGVRLLNCATSVFMQQFDKVEAAVAPGSKVVFYFSGDSLRWNGSTHLVMGDEQGKAMALSQAVCSRFEGSCGGEVACPPVVCHVSRCEELPVSVQQLVHRLCQRCPSDVLVFLDACRGPHSPCTALLAPRSDTYVFWSHRIVCLLTFSSCFIGIGFLSPQGQFAALCGIPGLPSIVLPPE
jgi:hypothetical protein